MDKAKTWVEHLDENHFDEWTRELLLKEMVRTKFVGNLPPGFAFLQKAFVDLGFENLGLPPDECLKLLLAFGGTGVLVPGTAYHLRFIYPTSLVEPANGTEQATLPIFWREGALVMNGDSLTWIGKRIRLERLGDLNLSLYHDEGDGYRLLD